MPGPERRRPVEGEAGPRERDREREGDKEKAKSKSGGKAKDLSHVPCKFFRVGSCTAGSSCPFSHNVLEPGQSKDVCSWFIKGNCKFGHKCALAHILPGQPMAMDRKNKKAAQTAGAGSSAAPGNGPGPGPAGAGAGGGPGPGAGTGGGGRNGRGRAGTAPGSKGPNSLLGGSTAPTRIGAAGGRPRPLPLKATISPSAPAPAITDADFATFGLPDESNQLASAPAAPDAPTDEQDEQVDASSPDAPEPAALHSGSPVVDVPRRPSVNHRPATDLGPIGSPPRASPGANVNAAGAPVVTNGFSPGTSPQHHFKALDLIDASATAILNTTSPFSAPGTQTTFPDADVPNFEFPARSGIAASLGATRGWASEMPLPDRDSASRAGGFGGAVVVEDDDLEEFIPSSLTDLLTPEEQSRRMSRTASLRPPQLGTSPSAGGGLAPRTASDSTQAHHRYSRSVPGTSLLGDIKSIWTDGVPGGAAGLGNGTPSSFKSISNNTGFGGREEAAAHQQLGLSPPMLSPSNASAAFLPGLHSHYMQSKATSARPPMRAAGSYTANAALAGPPPPNARDMNGIAMSPPHLGAFTGRPPLDSRPSDPYAGPKQLDADPRAAALSPSALVLQEHAPGKSLPQGLAAGYSRMHARAPPPSVPSPSLSGTFSPAHVHAPLARSPPAHTAGIGYTEWLNQPHHMAEGGQVGTSPAGGVTGMESMFSRLGYSTAAAGAGVGPGPGGPAVGARAPAGANRSASGRSYQSGQTPLSPLNGPVMTVGGGDDDDLFMLDH